jgi:hypothetical protein
MEYQRVVVVTDSQQLVKLWDGSGHRSAGCHIMQEMKLLPQLLSSPGIQTAIRLETSEQSGAGGCPLSTVLLF